MSELNNLFYNVFQKSSVPTMVVGVDIGLYGKTNYVQFKDEEKPIYKKFKIIHANNSLHKLFRLEQDSTGLYSESKIIEEFLNDLYQNFSYRIDDYCKNITYNFFFNDDSGRKTKLYVTADVVGDNEKNLVVSLSNVSESYKTELILKEFVEKHYLLLKYISDSIVLFDIGDYSIVEFNDNFVKLVEYNDNFKKNNIFHYFKDKNFEIMNDFLSKKASKIYDENKTVTLFLSDYNEKKIPAEINIFFSTLDNNKVAQLVIRDLRNQFELEEGKRILATAVDQSAESIMITDTNGNIQYVNPAFEQISGYSLSEILGQNPKFLQSDQTPKYTYKIMWGEIKKGKSWRGILINKKKNGEIYKEEATITPVKDRGGTITNYVAVKRDITHNLLLEDQVRQSQKMHAIGTLAGGIAHDFNNILTAIMGYAELSQSQCEKNSIIYSNLNEIIKGTDRAGQLVDQILKFSRKSEKNVLSVNLDTIVKEVLKLLRASVPANVNLIYEANESFFIKADPTQLSQIIMNLCTNAYQALEGKAGYISIKIFKKELSQKKGIEIGNLPKGIYVCLQIEDNGIGIPQEYKHRIFEPFFTTKKLHEGTGLGLSVVHGIVNDHRGAITVESAPGKGSCFTVYFPESEQTCIVSEKLSDVTSLKSFGSILVVDDEESITQFVAQVLTHLGYKVESCCSSKIAQQLFEHKNKEFDLVITDMGMPEMTGLELAKIIIKLKPDIPVIMCTGYSDKVSADNYSKKGFAGFIAKPFNAEQLVREVRRVMKRKSLSVPE